MRRRQERGAGSFQARVNTVMGERVIMGALTRRAVARRRETAMQRIQIQKLPKDGKERGSGKDL